MGSRTLDPMSNGDMSEEDIPIRESGESLVSSSISSSSTSSSGSDSDSSDDEGTSTDIETDSELERNTDLKKLASHRRREASKEPIIRVHCKINGESTNSVRTLESSKSCDIGKLMAMSAARRKEKEQKMNEQKRLARPASPEHKPLAPLPLESLAPRHSASTTQLPSLLKLPVYESSRLADPRRYARSTFRLLSTDADPMVASTSSIPTSSSLLSSKILDQETKKLEQRVERNKSEVSAQAQAIIGNVAAENRRNRGGNASGANEKFSDFFAFISQNQKLLQPAPNPSPEIRAFLEGGNKQLAGRTPPPSPRSGVQLPVVEPEEKLEQQNGDHSVSATPCQKVPERRGSLSTNDSPTVSIEDDENVEDLEAEDDDLLNQAMNESDLTKGVMTTEDDSIFEAVNDIDTLNVTSIEGVDEEFDKIMEEEAENLDVAIQNFTTIIEGGAELETESADFDLVSSPAPEKEPAKLDEPRPEPEGDLAARFRDEFDSLEYMDANASLASATPSFKRPLQVFNPPDSLKNVKQAEIKEATPPKAAMEEVDDLEEEFKQEVVHVVEAVNETVVEAVTAASSPETEGPDSHLSMDSEELAALRREAVERDVTPGTTPSSPHKAQQQTLGVPSPEVAKPLTVNVSEPPPVPKTQPPNEEDDVELDNTTNWFSKQSPFGSIRDSIHVRKSNLKKSPPKDKSPSPQPLLNAAKSPSPQPAGFMRPPMAKLLSLPTLRSPPPLSPPARPPPPVLWETKEQEVMRRVSEDREKQKNLVREMVLSKIKSPENRRERKFVRSSPSFVSQESLASGGAGSVGSGQVTTTPGVGNGLKSGVSESNLSPRKISAPTPQTSAGSLISPDEFYTPMTSFRPALRRPVSMAIPASTSNVLATMDETPTTTVSTADVAALLPDTPLTKPDRCTLNTIGKTLFSSPDLTQAVAATPDRVNWDDLRVLRTAEREKARQSVRDQIRVKSDAELGLSPPNTIESLKDRIRRRNGPPSAAPDDSKLQQVKDFQEDRKSKLEMLEKMAVFTPPQFGATARSCPTSPEKSAVRRAADISPCSSRISSPDACSSAPVSVAPALTPPPSAAGAAAAAASTEKRKKSKDPERRRSIIQLVHGLFSRSSADKEKEKQKNATRDAVCGGVASPTTSDLEAKAASPPLRSPKLKERASPFRLKNKEKQKEKKGKKKSTGPSPATTATPTSPSRLDDSFKALSLGEKSTLETPPTAVGADEVDDDDPLALLSGSAGTLTRRQEKIAKRLSRQAELKRLRMAQEIQRQLEELEVKQRELEERGVAVEKALRGEGTAVDNSKEETELMGEWFALVHEKTRLGRYEQELLVRAKELELEDRQARLQQNLRERLTVDDETKTKDDIAAEREILNEMVEIVEQRDTLLEMMEEDRLRYREEDKDLEAAMLAKGLQLTPIRKETGV